MKRLLIVLVLSVAACGTALKVEPVQVQPIHVTVDVNLKDADAPAAPAAPSMK